MNTITIESKTKLNSLEYDVICTIFSGRKKMLKGNLIPTYEAIKRRDVPRALLCILTLWYLWDSIFIPHLVTRGGLTFLVIFLAVLLVCNLIIKNRYKKMFEGKEYHYKFTFDQNGIDVKNYEAGTKYFSWEAVQGCYVIDDLIVFLTEEPKGFLFIRKIDELEKEIIDYITAIGKLEKIHYLDNVDGILKLQSVPTKRVKRTRVVKNIMTVIFIIAILILDYYGTGYIIYSRLFPRP